MKTCPICYTVFLSSKWSNRKYCTDRCQQKARRIRDAIRVDPPVLIGKKP